MYISYFTSTCNSRLTVSSLFPKLSTHISETLARNNRAPDTRYTWPGLSKTIRIVSWTLILRTRSIDARPSRGQYCPSNTRRCEKEGRDSRVLCLEFSWRATCRSDVRCSFRDAVWRL